MWQKVLKYFIYQLIFIFYGKTYDKIYLRYQEITIKSTLEAESVQISMCKVNNQFVKYSLKIDYASAEKSTVSCKSICFLKLSYFPLLSSRVCTSCDID